MPDKIGSMSKLTPLFLFGSGISPAPNVSDLTERIFSADLYRHSYGIWIPKNPQSFDRISPSDDPRYVRHFLGCLRQFCARRWNVPLSEVNYEHVAGLCRQLNYDADTDRDPAIAPFVDSLRDQVAISNEDFQYLPLSAHAWISSSIYWEFRRCASTSEDTQRFISSVIRPLGRSVVVTLNHDTYFEDEFGPDLNVGFSKTGCFSPDRLNEPSPHKLLKLHGSVNWSAADTITTLHTSWRSEAPDSVPLMLSGTITKLEDYNYLAFPWLWAEFQNSLRNTRRLVVCGYGFKDLGVNSRLTDWMKHYPDSRILILHPDPGALLNEVEKSQLGGVQQFFCRGGRVAEIISAAGQAMPNAQIILAKVGFQDAARDPWLPLVREFVNS